MSARFLKLKYADLLLNICVLYFWYLSRGLLGQSDLSIVGICGKLRIKDNCIIIQKTKNRLIYFFHKYSSKSSDLY